LAEGEIGTIENASTSSRTRGVYSHFDIHFTPTRISISVHPDSVKRAFEWLVEFSVPYAEIQKAEILEGEMVHGRPGFFFSVTYNNTNGHWWNRKVSRVFDLPEGGEKDLWNMLSRAPLEGKLGIWTAYG
jgi:hypothetical protein